MYLSRIIISLAFLLFTSNYSLAQTKINCDTINFTDIKSDTVKLTEIVYLIDNDYSINDYNERIKLASYGYCLAKQYNEKQIQALLLTEIGFCYYALGQHEEVTSHLNEALDLSIEIGYAEGQANSFNIFGLMYSELGIVTNSYIYQQKLLQLGELYDNKRWMADALVNIAVTLRDVGELEKAKELLFRAKDIYDEHLPKVSGRAWARIHLGKYYEIKNDSVNAFKYYDEAEFLMKINNHTSGLMSIFNLKGEYFLKTGNNKAKQFFEEALLIGKNLNYKNNNTVSNIGLGEYYYNIKEYDLAKEKLLEALDVCIEASFHKEAAKAAYYISLINEIQQNYKASVKYKNMVIKYGNQITDRDNKLVGIWIQSQAVINKKSKEYNQLKEISDLRKETIWKQKVMGLFGIIISILFFSLFISYFYNYKKRKKNNDKLRALNKSISEKSIALQNANEQIFTQKKQLELELTKKMLVLNIKENSLSQAFEIVEKAKIEDHASKRELIAILRDGKNELLREELDFQFNNINSQLFKKLSQQFPDLSKADLRLCAFLKLNLTSKDIAELTFKKEGSIKMARHRLRKKLGIANSNIDLTIFLNGIT